MSRWKASAIHLSISLAVAAIVATLLYRTALAAARKIDKT